MVFWEAGQFNTLEGQAVTVNTEVVSCPATVELGRPVTAALPPTTDDAPEAPMIEDAPEAPTAFPVEAGTAEDTETPGPHATPDLESLTLDSNRAKVVPGAARPEARSTQR